MPKKFIFRKIRGRIVPMTTKRLATLNNRKNVAQRAVKKFAKQKKEALDKGLELGQKQRLINEHIRRKSLQSERIAKMLDKRLGRFVLFGGSDRYEKLKKRSELINNIVSRNKRRYERMGIKISNEISDLASKHRKNITKGKKAGRLLERIKKEIGELF